jgi:hypothetical protein
MQELPLVYKSFEAKLESQQEAFKSVDSRWRRAIEVKSITFPHYTYTLLTLYLHFTNTKLTLLKHNIHTLPPLYYYQEVEKAEKDRQRHLQQHGWLLRKFGALLNSSFASIR